MYRNVVEGPLEPIDRRFFIKYQENTSICLKKGKEKLINFGERVSTKTDIYEPSRMTEEKNHQSITHKRYNIPSSEKMSKKKYHKQPSTFVGSLNHVLNEREETMEKEEKEIPRIPIELNDEKVNGCLADLLRMKVIYRGYYPKNSYFFLKNLSLVSTPGDATFRNEMSIRADF